MSLLEVERRDSVCRAVLNEPDKLNPLSDAMRRELEQLVRGLEEDDQIRVLVVSGAGRAFSAGVDLRPASEPHEGPSTGSAWARRRRRGGAWQRLLDGIEGLPQVTIARLHGRVVGGAALLGASCDLRVASDDVIVSIPEIALGIPLTWAGLPRLVREIGLPLTRDLVMSGREMRGEEALRCGYVTRLVSHEDLDAACGALVEQLVALPAAPLAMTKDALAAIGRAQPGSAASWSDPDLITWSGREPEGQAAAAKYVEAKLSRKK